MLRVTGGGQDVTGVFEPRVVLNKPVQLKRSFGQLGVIFPHFPVGNIAWPLVVPVRRKQILTRHLRQTHFSRIF